MAQATLKVRIARRLSSPDGTTTIIGAYYYYYHFLPPPLLHCLTRGTAHLFFDDTH